MKGLLATIVINLHSFYGTSSNCHIQLTLTGYTKKNWSLYFWYEKHNALLQPLLAVKNFCVQSILLPLFQNCKYLPLFMTPIHQNFKPQASCILLILIETFHTYEFFAKILIWKSEDINLDIFYFKNNHKGNIEVER